MKVSIVGTGFGLYGQLPAFNKIQDCTVVGICGDITDRVTNYCEKIGLKGIYTDYKELIEKEKPDVITIAVPPKIQYEIAKYALEKGIAVFAEKPLAVSVIQAKELYELAKEKRLPNMIDFIFPDIPEWSKVRELLDNGSIGAMRKIKLEWCFLSYDIKNQIKSWKTDPEEGGGALLFYFPHAFYYLEYFIGKIKSIDCKLSVSEKSLNKGETRIEMKLLFENGCVGEVLMDVASDEQKHNLEFHGEKGVIILENQTKDFVDNFEVKLIREGKTEIIEPNIQLESDPSDDPRVKIVQRLAERFVEWYNTGKASKPDFEDGLRVQELIEIARKSK